MTTVKTLTLYHACFKFGASRVGATSLSRVRPVDSYLMLKLHANWPSRTRDMMIQSCVALWPAVFTGSSTTYLGVVVVDGRILYVEHPPPNGEIPTHLTPITAKLHQLPCWWAKRSTWKTSPESITLEKISTMQKCCLAGNKGLYYMCFDRVTAGLRWCIVFVVAFGAADYKFSVHCNLLPWNVFA